ncbi:MAG: hypothetical protein Q7R70_06570 [Candidatus Diapherotrites archaeon]|nr:hypothetical protein [Candidatus Diapherotrites archaeon]
MLDSELQNFLLIGFFLIIILAYFMNSFQFVLFVLFAGLGAAFLLSGWALPGIICALAAGVLFLHFFWQGTKKHAEKGGHSLRKGLENEWKKVEAAKMKGDIGIKFWEENLKVAGKKSAEALLAKDGEKLSNPYPISRTAKGIKNFIDGFNKIFKKDDKK